MIRLAYGLPGTGKSTLLHDLVREQSGEHLFLVNDHEAGWGSDSPLWRGKPPPLRVVQGEDAAQAFFDEEEGPPSHGVIVYRNCDPVVIQETVISWGECVYVDDELDRAGRRRGFDDSPLRSMANEGRHLPNAAGEPCAVHILGACRRPQKIHNDLSELADEVFVFRCMGARAIARLLDDAVLEDDDVESVRVAPNFHFLHWPSRQWFSVPPL